MNEIELEEMIVRLTGDTTQYQRAIKQAEDSTAGSLGRMGNHTDGFGDQLTRLGEKLVAAAELYGMSRFLQEGLEAWRQQEDATLRLNAVMIANGRAVADLMPQYEEFAESIMHLTTQSDETTLSFLAQAESYGLMGTAAQDAVQNAMGFAAINDGNAASYLRFTAAMVRGDTEMMMRFARMVPQLRGIKDEAELVAKAQLLAATGFDVAQKQAQTFTGQLKQLHDAYGELLEDIGKVASAFMKPFVTMKIEFAKLVSGTDADIKEMVILIGLVVSTLVSVGPAIAIFNSTAWPLIQQIKHGFAEIKDMIQFLFSPTKVLAAIWAGLGTAVGAVFSLWGLAAIAFVAVLSAVVISLGGFKATWVTFRDTVLRVWESIKFYAVQAWDYVKQKTQEFLVWVKPITDALGSFFRTAWSLIKTGAESVWNVTVAGFYWMRDRLMEVWDYITDGAVLDWEVIRDSIQTAILFAEFTMLNFKQVCETAWTGIKLSAFVAFDAIRAGFVFMLAAAAANVNIQIRMYQQLWRVIRGESNALTFLDDVAEQWRTDFEEVANALGGITESGTTAALRAEFNAQRNALQVSFEEFRRQRLAEFAVSPEAIDQARRAGTQIGQSFNSGMSKEIQKFDAALRYSAEALSRISAYQDRLNGNRNAESRSSAALSAFSPDAAARLPVPQGGRQGTATDAQQDLIRQYLLRIATASEVTARRPAIVVQEAGLS